MQPSPSPDDPEATAGASREPARGATPRSAPGHRRADSRRGRARVRRERAPRRPAGRSRQSGRQRESIETFDEFYLTTRKRVLLQSLALTGDLDVARAAVRDAYVAAYHHWRKVGRTPDPESWVRPRAWGRARRRARAHPLRREKGVEPEQRHVLDGLSRLSDPQRRTLLLAHLASLPMDAIGRELALPRAQVEQHLQTGTAQLALELDCPSTNIRPRLETLAPAVASPGLPRVTTIRRAGVRQRRWHLVGAAVAAVALASGSGWFVSTQSPALGNNARRALEHPVKASMLLGPQQFRPVAATGWRTTSTGPNTSGSGLHSACQAARFADDRGLAAWTRTFSGPKGRRAVQAVEVSTSPGAAEAAYERTVRWYAGCADARAHLTRSYRISGLGEESVAIELSAPEGWRYLVNVARSDELTQTTLVRTPVAADRLASVDDVAAAAMKGVCPSGAVSRCRTGPMVAKRSLLPTGAPPRMLATVDLPLLDSVRRAWVGTRARASRVNHAATPCDKTTFSGKGRRPRTRSFLVPKASLPAQFGITETYARFAGAARAKAFVGTISHRMRTCEDRNLGSKVTDPITGHDLAGWRVSSEINADHKAVAYWMGVVRVGRFVAQIGFTPTDEVNVSREEFTGLLVRARDRLAIRKGAHR